MYVYVHLLPLAYIYIFNPAYITTARLLLQRPSFCFPDFPSSFGYKTDRITIYTEFWAYDLHNDGNLDLKPKSGTVQLLWLRGGGGPGVEMKCLEKL